MFLGPIVGQHLEGICLEGSKTFPCKFFCTIDTRLSHNYTPLNPCPRYDLYGCTLIDQRKVIRIRNRRQIDLARTEDRSDISTSRRVDKLKVNTVLLSHLTRVGQKYGHVA